MLEYGNIYFNWLEDMRDYIYTYTYILIYICSIYIYIIYTNKSKETFSSYQ